MPKGDGLYIYVYLWHCFSHMEPTEEIRELDIFGIPKPSPWAAFGCGKTQPRVCSRATTVSQLSPKTANVVPVVPPKSGWGFRQVADLLKEDLALQTHGFL